MSGKCLSASDQVVGYTIDTKYFDKLFVITSFTTLLVKCDEDKVFFISHPAADEGTSF